MSTKVLVAYSTRYGSTQEVAEAIAASLRECGLEADIQPMLKVRGVEGYGAVVLGAPIFYNRWHKDALRFLSQHREALTQRPVAIFALGPLGTEEKDMQGARAALDKALINFPWLAPMALEMFVGKFDPAKLRFPENLIPALRRMPASDNRDWSAIRTWANSLAEKLRSGMAKTTDGQLTHEIS
jgi:menaquinone-dependent protoporphyrinogen oxidase